jgi:hypothetical protein
VADLLPATFAALGVVIGFIVGSIVSRIVWWLVFPLTSSDVVPIVAGGLGCAIAFAWLGIRLSVRFANRSVEPT